MYFKWFLIFIKKKEVERNRGVDSGRKDKEENGSSKVENLVL